MFISNKEKAQISEKFEHNKSQIESLIKHVGKLQVDISNTGAISLDGMRQTDNQLYKMFYGSEKKIKNLQNSVQSANATCAMLIKKNEALVNMVELLNQKIQKLDNKPKKIGRPPKKITIRPEKVQEMKDAGVWDDPIKRIEYIDALIKEEKEAKLEQAKERNREYARKYYQRKQAEKKAKEAQL